MKLEKRTDHERNDLMLAYAADALDAPEAEGLRARLAAGDPRLAGALAEADTILSLVSATATPIHPNSSVKAKLLASLPRKNLSATIMLPQISVNKPRVRWAGLAAAAAAVGAIFAGGIAWYAAHENLNPKLRSAERSLAQSESRVEELQGMLGSAHAMVASLGSPAGTSATFGRVILEPDKRQMRVYIFDLVPPPPGRVYQLWFLPKKGAPIPAPTFQIDASGKASLMVSIPADLQDLPGAAVSDEPPGGSKQVSGTVRLVSSKPI